MSTSQGSILDDEVLVNTLQSSKKTSEDVTEQLKVAEETEIKIDAAREVRKPSRCKLCLCTVDFVRMYIECPIQRCYFCFILQGYRPCAQRASILFFVMNDMGRVDPMYQFSLDAYILLFSTSIDKSLKHPQLEERISYLNEYHTFAVYQYTCRGLFERHKLLFSFQMCAKILEAATKLNLDEYNFFLRGGVVSVVYVH